MKKYLKYLKSDLLPALEHLPNPETFGLLYGDGFETGDLSKVPVKSIAEWLGIDTQTLPPADRLTPKQQLSMADTLLSYWQEDDELALVIRCTPPKRQYEAAIEYIRLKGRYNGYGGFELIETAISDEEWAEIRKTHDKMMEGLHLPFLGTEKDDTNKISDEDLPF